MNAHLNYHTLSHKISLELLSLLIKVSLLTAFYKPPETITFRSALREALLFVLSACFQSSMTFVPMVDARQKTNENSSSQATAASVHFNVGGTPYQVSRSLLEQHADTMLARMASEIWQGENPPEEAMFVERDGGRFGYVLDFMRDGQVSLPAKGKITEESLLKELTYFGFLNVDPSVITTEFHYLDIPRYMALITQEYNEELTNKTKQRDALNLNITCTTVAHACCIRYMTTGNLNVCFDKTSEERSGSLDNAVVAAVQGHSLEHVTEALNKSLAKYGLHCCYYNTSTRRYNSTGRNNPDVVTITLARVE